MSFYESSESCLNPTRKSSCVNARGILPARGARCWPPWLDLIPPPPAGPDPPQLDWPLTWPPWLDWPLTWPPCPGWTCPPLAGVTFDPDTPPPRLDLTPPLAALTFDPDPPGWIDLWPWPPPCWIDLWPWYPPGWPGTPSLWTDRWMDRHVSKHYLPVVLRTRAVKMEWLP